MELPLFLSSSALDSSRSHLALGLPDLEEASGSFYRSSWCKPNTVAMACSSAAKKWFCLQFTGVRIYIFTSAEKESLMDLFILPEWSLLELEIGGSVLHTLPRSDFNITRKMFEENVCLLQQGHFFSFKVVLEQCKRLWKALRGCSWSQYSRFWMMTQNFFYTWYMLLSGSKDKCSVIFTLLNVQQCLQLCLYMLLMES